MNKKFTFEQKQYILKLGPCQPSAQEMQEILINYFSDLEKTCHLPKHLHKTDLISYDGDSNDVNSDSGEEEAISLPSNSMNISSLLYIFQLFTHSSIKYVLPNIYILVKIGVILPVSSATTKRSF
ncbi:uncharacterized protein LOC112690564 [Sipha flava]|jgi:hypothetical protein|uniref:Uncharacterized protein LOC112690564 n=2 Tax=Sipha flava TaxID=143950 RepID=A0A8B8GCF3_9HEMI|nr:uncharacterized protein LOC112690564 [Sipha flava]XP_025420392.1 uncharacterized protein LOC112690564 [Sipha flava]